MADEKLYVHVVLDRSGSMEACRKETIAAFNQYVNQLAEQSASSTRLSLTMFDSESIDLAIDTKRIRDISPLTEKDFVPRASTPLLDAVGRTVLQMDRVTLLDGERVALAILTDGLENASREFTAEAVRKLLMERSEKQNWLIQYLGANQDAWQVAQTLGVTRAMAMSYSTDHMHEAMRSMGRSLGRYRMSDRASARRAAEFTKEERAASKGGDAKKSN